MFQAHLWHSSLRLEELAMAVIDRWAELVDERLVWLDAEVAVYRREDGCHASYVFWRDGDAAAERKDGKQFCLLELRTGMITACGSVDEAHQLVAELENKAGRADPKEAGADRSVCDGEG